MNLRFVKYYVFAGILIANGCSPAPKNNDEKTVEEKVVTAVTIEAEDFTKSTGEDIENPTTLTADTWLAFDVDFEVTGRYRSQVFSSFNEGAKVWVEDYYDNTDERTYDVTGKIVIGNNKSGFVEGSPFRAGNHKIKVHASEGEVTIDKIVFTLMVEHQVTPKLYEQKMNGDEWKLVWSDEFDGEVVDTTKWNYDFGDWGWGNNELQYYTDNRKENARVEDGNLIIEARKNDDGNEWTSARLTTRGKETFKYGKIEFRAKAPRGKGNWAAAWTLGDSYLDEKSWPYCGEIDILESVGYEVNDETGDGTAHVTVHTPAYYFKKENQIGSTKDIVNIAGEFHTYAVEWTPTEIRGYVDEEQYYVYDKKANKLEWPFDEAQNIIINLAMGGGWGGAQGMDPSITSQQFIIDYVRVFDLN